jgi:L-ascorbate metabolism protein UlaG (beta-lactamase superfamily)
MTITYIAAIFAITGFFGFTWLKSFGRLPRGARLERVKRSPNYHNGTFRNQHVTPTVTNKEGSRYKLLIDFLFQRIDGLRPDKDIPTRKSDMTSLDLNKNLLVWFGHSSYMIQIDGKRFLIDPVFYNASPVPFTNRAFKGTTIFKPEDLPAIDYLIITHDHWDHLDYKTVIQLKDRIKKVICPLGVGESFEYWGFQSDQIIELDWNDDADIESGFTIHCLPARHFSGRGLVSNKTLWASFLLEARTKNIFIGGDGGYDTHFAQIGERFPNIDLAILENGQYNEDWKYIHLLPKYLVQVAKELNAKEVLTVHHSKYALARHRWDEPLNNEKKASESIHILMPLIGEITIL